MAVVIKDGEAEEVMKQIAALRDRLEGKSGNEDDSDTGPTLIPPPFKQVASH